VTLTDIGQRYFEDAAVLLADLKTAEDTARGAHVTPSGTLRVTAPVMFGQHYITPVITNYLSRNAEVSVDALFVDRVVNIVEEGIDVAVRIGPLKDSSLIATGVGSVRLLVCGSPEYLARNTPPEVPADLAQHETIGLVLGNFQADWKFTDREVVKLVHRVNYNSIPAAIAAAKSGWRLVRVLSYQVASELATGQLQTVLPRYAPAPLPVSVVHGHGRRASAKVRTFFDLAVDALRADQALKIE
jgi:DNA-binding transcriptional LysR family regulator